MAGSAMNNQDEMPLSVVHLGNTVIVCVAGEVELSTAPRLEELLTAQLAARPAALVVDLDEVSFLTSTGLTALALAQRDAREYGVDLRIVASGNVTLRPLQITGMTEELAIYPSRADALRGLPAISG